jgi:hypothetical protein
LVTSCHFLQCLYLFLRVLLLFNTPYISTLLFCPILSWLKKLFKIMEGGLSPPKISFFYPTNKNYSVFFMNQWRLFNILNCTWRLQLDFHVKKPAENWFKITLGMKGSSGSLLAIGTFFIWSTVREKKTRKSELLSLHSNIVFSLRAWKRFEGCWKSLWCLEKM